MKKDTSQEEPVNHLRSIRETVEVLVVALGLAFFLKAFAAEAFVIPTGSMATTLMGRHKDVRCEVCNYPFQISASEEMNNAADGGRGNTGVAKVLAGTCPQCRYTMYVGPDSIGKKKTFPSFNGDRIFVNKSLFDFREPKRWHVTVFRYPASPQVNYIKRLVGVENETIRLQHGDVFVRKNDQEEFAIQRKPLRALLSMLRLVDDNDYVQPDLHKIGWPTRWFDDTEHWKRSDDYKTFSITRDKALDKSAETTWLNYRHIVPTSDDWYFLIQKKMPPTGAANNPQLVTDFIGYNTGILRVPERFSGQDPNQLILTPELHRDGQTKKDYFCRKNTAGLGLNWVGDLAVSCTLLIERPEGTFLLRAIKGGLIFQCEIDIATGAATLSIQDPDNALDELHRSAAVPTPVRANKCLDLLFCNVDEQMRLVVNGREIDFGKDSCYDALCGPGGPLARNRAPTALDLMPVGIGTRGATLKIGNLKVRRDMYYIACNERWGEQLCDMLEFPYYYPFSEDSVARVLSTPGLWKNFGKTNGVTIKLEKDQFLMLGDNSAKSKDSRLWTTDGIPPYVSRELLIGEPVFVYWPHGWCIPGTGLALIPNITKMRPID